MRVVQRELPSWKMACPSVRRLHRAPLIRGARSASSQALVRSEQAQHRLVGLFRKGGSEQEDRQNNGISGFFQRVQQRGTKQHNGASLHAKVAGANGRVHSVNDRQYNGTLFHSPKQHVGDSIALLADMARNPVLNKDDIELERSSSLRTLDAAQYDLERVIKDYMHDIAFQGTGLALSPLGNTDGLTSITQESLQQFASDVTVGENLCLAVVGDVDHAQVMEAAEKHLQSIPAGNAFVQPDIRYSGAHVNIRDDDMSLCYTGVGFEAPAYGNADCLALDAVRHITGSYDRSFGSDARHGLNRAAYESHNWEMNTHCFAIRPFTSYYSNVGLFGNFMITSNGSQEATFSYISQEWHRIRHRCRDADVDRAKCDMKVELSKLSESPTAQVELMGKQMMTLGRVIPAHEMDQRIDNVHADFVRSAMDEYMYDTDPVYAEVGSCETELDYHVIKRMLYITDIPDSA